MLCCSCSACALISSAVAASSSDALAFCWVVWLNCTTAELIWLTPEDCSSEAADISCTRSEVRLMLGTIESSKRPARSANSTLELATSPISCAATWLRSASLRTSAATTANPLPCSPARAASIAALSASRLVWYAMSSMMPIFCAICFIAWVVATTASPPSTVSLAAWVAMPSVIRAFSVFWLIDAVICSSEALVSSTPAACSLAACDSDCAVALTSSDALARVSALVLTSPTTCDSFPTMVRIASSNCAVSSRPCTSIRMVRSPSDKPLATATARRIGPVTLRLITTPRMAPSNTPLQMMATSSLELRAWIAPASALAAAALRSRRPLRSVIRLSTSSELARTARDSAASSGLASRSASRLATSMKRPRSSRYFCQARSNCASLFLPSSLWKLSRARAM